MKLKHFFIALTLMAFKPAVAQIDVEASLEQYRQEVAQSVIKMQGDGKQNAAPEPFKDFIKKFSSDEAFMESRIALPTGEREKFSGLLTLETFTAKEPVVRENEGIDDIYYQIWDEMQFHTVHLDCCWDGILEHTIIFDRKNGKWYLTQILE